MGAPKGKPHRKFTQAEKLAYITCIRCNGRIYEWVLFIDTFNNEILRILFLHIEGIPKPTITVWINYANA